MLVPPLALLLVLVPMLVRAVVLVARPWGLFGRPQSPSRHASEAEQPLRAPGPLAGYARWAMLALLVLMELVLELQLLAVLVV